jgi:hypothetical protein
MIGYIVIQQRNTNKEIDTFEACVGAGYPVQDSYPERCVTPDGDGFTRPIEGNQEVSFEGLLVCLPHKDMDGPHTLECASGLRTDDQKYYSLSSQASDTTLSEATGSDRRVRIDGVLKKETDTKYQREGIITVTHYEFMQ